MSPLPHRLSSFVTGLLLVTSWPGLAVADEGNGRSVEEPRLQDEQIRAAYEFQRLERALSIFAQGLGGEDGRGRSLREAFVLAKNERVAKLMGQAGDELERGRFGPAIEHLDDIVQDLDAMLLLVQKEAGFEGLRAERRENSKLAESLARVEELVSNVRRDLVGGDDTEPLVKPLGEAIESMRTLVRSLNQSVAERSEGTERKSVEVVGPTNVRIARVRVTEHAVVRTPFEITAFVESSGLDGRCTSVELLHRVGGRVVRAQTVDGVNPITVRTSGGEATTRVVFSLSSRVAGEVEFLVRATPVPNLRETNVDDNEVATTVQVDAERTRVLIVAGGPMRDFRFVRTMLDRAPGIELAVWLQSTTEPAPISGLRNLPSAEELGAFDLVVAFDPDWEAFSTEWCGDLARWVSRGGGLILVAGDVNTPKLVGDDEKLDAIRELYPVSFKQIDLDLSLDASDTGFPVRFTREGSRSGFEKIAGDIDESAALWEDFDGFYRSFPGTTIRRQGVVLAELHDPVESSPILLASLPVQLGRVLYLGSPESWRLRSLGVESFEQWWTNLIAFTRRPRGASRRATIVLDRERYLLGETVSIRGRFLSPRFEPLQVESIELNVVDPRGGKLVPPPRMRPDPDEEGIYVGQFPVRLAGEYRITVTGFADEDQVEKKVRVEIPTRPDVAPADVPGEVPLDDPSGTAAAGRSEEPEAVPDRPPLRSPLASLRDEAADGLAALQRAAFALEERSPEAVLCQIDAALPRIIDARSALAAADPQAGRIREIAGIHDRLRDIVENVDEAAERLRYLKKSGADRDALLKGDDDTSLRAANDDIGRHIKQGVATVDRFSEELRAIGDSFEELTTTGSTGDDQPTFAFDRHAELAESLKEREAFVALKTVLNVIETDLEKGKEVSEHIERGAKAAAAVLGQLRRVEREFFDEVQYLEVVGSLQKLLDAERTLRRRSADEQKKALESLLE